MSVPILQSWERYQKKALLWVQDFDKEMLHCYFTPVCSKQGRQASQCCLLDGWTDAQSDETHCDSTAAALLLERTSWLEKSSEEAGYTSLTIYHILVPGTTWYEYWLYRFYYRVFRAIICLGPGTRYTRTRYVHIDNNNNIEYVRKIFEVHTDICT